MDELTHGIVFRLATVKDTFPPDSGKLHPAHLELSERDKARDVPLLSVFESPTTKIREAVAIRGVAAESAAFGLEVEAIRLIRVKGLPVNPRVLRDPLDPPESEMPGAEGHCGIEGLYRKEGEPRRPFLELRMLLAEMSFPYRDETS